MDFFKKINKISVKILELTMFILMVVMTVSMFFQIITRYLFGTGLAWTEELARFSNVWLIFLGAAVLASLNEHINVTILDAFLKGTALKLLLLFRDLVFIAYSMLIVTVGVKTLAIVSSQTSPNMLLPMNYIYVAIPVGGIFIIIYLISNWILLKGKEEDNG